MSGDHQRTGLTAALLVLLSGCAAQPTQETLRLGDGRPYEFPVGVPENAVLSHDGSFFAFVDATGGQGDIYVHRIADASVYRLTNTPERESDVSLSVDGAHLAFRAFDGVYVIGTQEGATAERLTPEGLSAGSPAISPDGSTVVFHSSEGGSQDIWIVDVESKTRTRLTNHPDFVWRPNWSPDGKSIVFYATWEKAMTEIYTVEVENKKLMRVTDSPTEDFFPFFSPDGTEILFATRRDNTGTAIWAHDLKTGIERALTQNMYLIPLRSPYSGPLYAQRYFLDSHVFRVGIKGGDVEQITSGAFAYENPVASPNDDAFIAISTKVGPEATAVLMTQEGEERRAYGDGLALNRRPEFSPNGEWVMFQKSVGGWRDSNEIWIARRDGSDQHQVTAQGYMVSGLWCGGEDGLVFSGRTDGRGQAKLWRGKLGSTATELLLESKNELIASDCSPDGESVIYTEYAPHGPLLKSLHLETSTIGAVPHAPAAGEGLRYSPDGRSFAFVSDDNVQGQKEIYVVTAGATEPVRLTNSEMDKSWPSWERSGEYLLFSGDRTYGEVYVFEYMGD